MPEFRSSAQVGSRPPNALPHWSDMIGKSAPPTRGDGAAALVAIAGMMARHLPLDERTALRFLMQMEADETDAPLN